MSTAEASRGRKRRIVILGGGVGAMTAAFGLTSYPGWKDQYEVALYNIGWRLGGKGASGRNKDIADRIEEHGLHVWMGHYENAFRVLREAYKELGRPASAPLATLDAAFKKQSLITLFERTANDWVQWDFPVPLQPAGAGERGCGRLSLAGHLCWSGGWSRCRICWTRGRVAALVTATAGPDSLPARVEGTLRALGRQALLSAGAAGHQPHASARAERRREAAALPA